MFYLMEKNHIILGMLTVEFHKVLFSVHYYLSYTYMISQMYLIYYTMYVLQMTLMFSYMGRMSNNNK